MSGMNLLSFSDSSDELPGDDGGMASVRQGVVDACGGEAVAAVVVLLC